MITRKQSILKNIFNWLLDKWLAGFMTGSFLFLLKQYIDLPAESKNDFFHFHWIKSILLTEIELWKVIIIISFVIIMFWTRNWWKKRKENSIADYLRRPNDLEFNYRVDIFGVDNAKWTWDYDWEPNKKTMIVMDVFPLCPVCNSKMQFYPSNSATCAKCRLEGKQYHFHLQQFDSDVSKEVVIRLNTGEWKTRTNNYFQHAG
jgi:hypothetical protein